MKGILKSLAGLTLAFSMPIAFLAGMNMFVINASDISKLNDKKEKVLQGFTQTQVYEDEIDKKENQYLEDLNQGEISPIAYNIKVANLDSTSVTEDIAFQYASEETKSELNKINEAIAEIEKDAKKGLIITAVSCVLCMPTLSVGFKMLPSKDYQFAYGDERDYESLQKEVII